MRNSASTSSFTGHLPPPPPHSHPHTNHPHHPNPHSHSHPHPYPHPHPHPHSHPPPSPLDRQHHPNARVCDIIRSLGRKIGFPLQTLAMAQFIYHLCPSLSSTSCSDLACACLFVAGKLADTPKKLKDILGRTLAQRYDSWRSRIIHFEKEIMLALRFQFNIPLPFDFLIQLCKKANCDKRLSRHAWVLLFDMYQTSIVIRFPPYVLAMAALSLAAQIYDHELNQQVRSLLNSCKEDLHEITSSVLDFLISTTASDKPCYEKYRTLKIALNQQLPPPVVYMKRIPVPPSHPPQMPSTKRVKWDPPFGA